MADRPLPQDHDPEVTVPAPVWVMPPMRVTKEQLAAAERTRDYHVRKLQRLVPRTERSADTGTRSEF